MENFITRRQRMHHPDSLSLIEQKNHPALIVLTPASVTKFLSLIAAVLVAIHILLVINKHFLYYENDVISRLNLYFHLGREMTVPAFFSFLILILSSLLSCFIFFSIRLQQKNNRLPWMVLSLVFVFLSLDEAFSFHETYGQQAGDYLLGKKKVVYFSWVIPYAILAIGAALIFAKFLFKLPFKTRILFIVAGLIYIMGAIGMEVVGGMIVKHIHSESLLYAVSECLEETMEMAGVILFIYALLDYISKNNLKFNLRPAAK